MGTDEYRAASRQQWRSAAETWGREADRLDQGAAGAATRWLLDAAGLAQGSDVLELACGPGGVGISAAELVGPRGHVLCTDFAEPMVEVVEERVKSLGLTNVEARVLDAERMDLPDGTYHAVLCRFGYMLMADPLAALSETRRVLSPLSRVALAVWAEPEANPWISALAGAIMRRLGAPPPPPDAPGIFSMADPARITRLLEQAGFEDIRIERLESIEQHDSPDAWWAFITKMAAPLRALLEGMSAEDQAAVRTAAYETIAGFAGEDGLAIPSAVQVASARRPG